MAWWTSILTGITLIHYTHIQHNMDATTITETILYSSIGMRHDSDDADQVPFDICESCGVTGRFGCEGCGCGCLLMCRGLNLTPENSW